MSSSPVLVVDDDPGVRVLLDTLLQRAGFKAEFAENGAVAVERIRRTSYAAILLDLMLPSMNGFEIIRFIRADRPHLLRRIIVLTAAADRTLQNFSDEKDIWALVRKPFDVTELMLLVSACANGDGHSKSEA